MGQWVGVKMSVNLRPALYEAVLGLLDPSEDLAVRLEAAQTLKTDILKKCVLAYMYLFFNWLDTFDIIVMFLFFLKVFLVVI